MTTELSPVDPLQPVFTAQQRAHLENLTPDVAARRAALDRLAAMLDTHWHDMTAAVQRDFGVRNPFETELTELVQAKGAIRAAGLREQWSPPGESSSELIRELLDVGVAGLRVAVQLHGATTSWEPLPDLCDVLREAGADVVPVPVYRWTPPDDTEPMSRMIDAVINRDLDAITFTSAPAVASMLGQAHSTGAAVVTFELPAPSSRRRVLIPDACRAMGVSYFEPFGVYRRLGLRFS